MESHNVFQITATSHKRFEFRRGKSPEQWSEHCQAVDWINSVSLTYVWCSDSTLEQKKNE